MWKNNNIFTHTYARTYKIYLLINIFIYINYIDGEIISRVLS